MSSDPYITDIVVTPAARVLIAGELWFYAGRCAVCVEPNYEWSDQYNQMITREHDVAEYESEDGMTKAWFRYREEYKKVEVYDP